MKDIYLAIREKLKRKEEIGKYLDSLMNGKHTDKEKKRMSLELHRKLSEIKNQKYLDLDEATELSDKHNGLYRDIAFSGTVRIFGACDAYIEEYYDLMDKNLMEDDFDSFQVKAHLMANLDKDLNGKDYRKPWYRPFNIETKVIEGSETNDPNDPSTASNILQLDID